MMNNIQTSTTRLEAEVPFLRRKQNPRNPKEKKPRKRRERKRKTILLPLESARYKECKQMEGPGCKH